MPAAQLPICQYLHSTTKTSFKHRSLPLVNVVVFSDGHRPIPLYFQSMCASSVFAYCSLRPMHTPKLGNVLFTLTLPGSGSVGS